MRTGRFWGHARLCDPAVVAVDTDPFRAFAHRVPVRSGLTGVAGDRTVGRARHGARPAADRREPWVGRASSRPVRALPEEPRVGRSRYERLHAAPRLRRAVTPLPG